MLSDTIKLSCEDGGQRQKGRQLTTLNAFWPDSFLNFPQPELRDVRQVFGKIPTWALSAQLGGPGKPLTLSGLHCGVRALSDRVGLFGGTHEVAYMKALCKIVNISVM